MNKQILIVEDERDIANVFRKQLILLGGYDVHFAVDGITALESMKKREYDLVFLDLVMPKLDGIQVLERMTKAPQEYKKSPIIVLTNVTSPESKCEAEKHDITAVIIKTDVDIDIVLDDFFNGKIIKGVYPSNPNHTPLL